MSPNPTPLRCSVAHNPDCEDLNHEPGHGPAWPYVKFPIQLYGLAYSHGQFSSYELLMSLKYLGCYIPLLSVLLSTHYHSYSLSLYQT